MNCTTELLRKTLVGVFFFSLNLVLDGLLAFIDMIYSIYEEKDTA